MSSNRFDWQSHGYATPPESLISPKDAGLTIYRAWGGTSSEWGSGYFSLERPSSVLDAELRFNIADWGNGVHFVSTFRLKPGFPYFKGPVAHGGQDLSRPGTQIYVTPDIRVKVDLVHSKLVLTHDVSVVSRTGHA